MDSESRQGAHEGLFAQQSRRSALKKIGAGSALIWSAPVIASLNVAHAQTNGESPSPGDRGCITMGPAGDVDVQVVLKSAAHTLEVGIDSPVNGVVCSSCVGGESATFGPFAAGTGLHFYLFDHGGGCDGGCSVYLPCDGPNANITKVSDTVYTIGWSDAGCGCDRVGYFGDNLRIQVTIP